MGAADGAIRYSYKAMYHVLAEHSPVAHGHRVQSLVTDGPYAQCRHPMYAGMLATMAGLGLLQYLGCRKNQTKLVILVGVGFLGVFFALTMFGFSVSLLLDLLSFCPNSPPAFRRNTWWVAITSLPFVAYLHSFVIPLEERYLASHFPEEWPSYAATTRRWGLC